MLLIDQLDLLASTMDKVLRRGRAGPTPTALVAHGRFLAEKFGHASTGGTLDVGSTRGRAARPAADARLPPWTLEPPTRVTPMTRPTSPATRERLARHALAALAEVAAAAGVDAGRRPRRGRGARRRRRRVRSRRRPRLGRARRVGR